ncbi:hypothetical protein [Bradyrhizobium sp. WSM1743]|uniref:hypothetical protein n=1 Tax=Bradyrhizobium sp. WSM1743 TaxID=318996 RepID=UPI0006877A65|nr:hypothetical protein [Bradyrhizobium sp. WSM1743]
MADNACLRPRLRIARQSSREPQQSRAALRTSAAIWVLLPPAIVDRHDGGHGAAEKASELIHAKPRGRSLDDLLWSTVNLFDRAVDRVERELAINEQALQRGQREQNGWEVRFVEPERLTAEVLALIDCWARWNSVHLGAYGSDQPSTAARSPRR